MFKAVTILWPYMLGSAVVMVVLLLVLGYFGLIHDFGKEITQFLQEVGHDA